MKLIVAIVDDQDVDKVMTALTDQHIGVTCVSSTGGLIIPGNSTLLIGVDDAHAGQAVKVITDLAAPRQSHLAITYAGDISLASYVETQVGGYLTFVLAVDQFEQV